MQSTRCSFREEKSAVSAISRRELERGDINASADVRYQSQTDSHMDPQIQPRPPAGRPTVNLSSTAT